jgi:hypothetical protein
VAHERFIPADIALIPHAVISRSRVRNCQSGCQDIPGCYSTRICDAWATDRSLVPPCRPAHGTMVHAILLIISRLLLYLDAIRDCTLKLLYSMRSGSRLGRLRSPKALSMAEIHSGSRSRARQLPALRAVSPVTPAPRRRLALLEYLVRDSPSLRVNRQRSSYYTMFADSNNNATMFLTAIFDWR